MQPDQPVLSKHSPLFWLTLLVPLGILPIGLNFIFNPASPFAAFRFPANDPGVFPYSGSLLNGRSLLSIPFLFRTGNQPEVIEMSGPTTIGSHSSCTRLTFS